MRVGPLGFLCLVAVAWTAARVAMLWPDAPVTATPLAAVRPSPKPMLQTLPIASAEPEREQLRMPSRVGTTSFVAQKRRQVTGHGIAVATGIAPVSKMQSAAPPSPAQSQIPTASPGFAPVRSDERGFSFSVWALVRNTSASTLATGGQLGGSQAGVRARVRLARGLHAAARLSAPLGGEPGAEAALGLDWRQVARLPVTVTVERRVGIDRGGRDAFAAGLFGGVDQVRLPARVRLDAYGQAGVVGIRRRDLYADGAVRLDRTVASLGGGSLAVGGGAWGGAQPGASRVDVGPQLVLRVPVARGGLRLGAEWRERVAGNARPGSGPALSLGADF
jgi:hypothetical protein